MPRILEKPKIHFVSLKLNHEEYETLRVISQVMGENISDILRSFIPVEMKNSFEFQFKRVKKNARVRLTKSKRSK